MHIIFGKEQANELANKYTVLELDTFQLGEHGPTVTAYCTVENIPFEELAHLPDLARQHQDLLINYRGRAWQDCMTAIDELTGKWRGELDTFYLDLRNRIVSFIVNPPPVDWSPVIQR